MRSFRLRLALISAGISVLVLVVFGVVASEFLYRERLARLDADLMRFGFKTATRAGANVDGKRTETSLVEMYGVEVAGERFFMLLDRNGRELHRSGGWLADVKAADYPAGEVVLSPQPVVPGPPARGARRAVEPRFYTVSAGGQRYRLGAFGNQEVTMLLGANLDRYARDVSLIRRAFLIALPGAVLLIALGAVFVARRALRPIEVLSDRMETVSAEGLDQRLEMGNADVEFRRIIEAHNAMMGRLEKSFHQANRFSADASHELKTPLAVMQGTLERALGTCEDGSDAQRVYSELLDELAHQRRVLSNLLLLSRADAGEMALSKEVIDLSGRLETWLEDGAMLAEERRIQLESEIEKGIEVEADPVMFQQVVHNLLSNAVKYNEDGGHIRCRLSASGEVAELRILNTGEPIREEDCERVFERFYRSGGGRAEGAGLGLSLAREIVRAHGGAIGIGDGEDGMTEFFVRLPRFPGA
ncbi:MAG: ATP-binding protein [Verrucomicrobiota bacterium]